MDNYRSAIDRLCTAPRVHLTRVVWMLFVFSACATSTRVANVREAPHNRPLEVLTKRGTRYRFNSWVVSDSNGIVGMSRKSPDSTTSLETVFVPADSILSLASVDNNSGVGGDIAIVTIAGLGAFMFIWVLLRYFTQLFRL